MIPLVARPQYDAFFPKQTAKREALHQLDTCDALIRYVDNFIKQLCRVKDYTCPTTIIDPVTKEQRKVTGLDKLPDCATWRCTIDQMKQWSTTFRDMIEQDAYRGVSLSSQPRPFTTEDYHELRDVIKSKCKLQTELLGQLAFTSFKKS